MDKLNWVRRTFGLFLLCAATAIALPAQTFNTVYSFQYKDGTPADPYSGLVQATDGDLYGTTILGGSLQACNFGCGSIYKITPGGTVTTLYSFCVQRGGCPDGDSPYAPLIQANGGNLYGTTYGGGTNGNYGTVFRITLGGKLARLYDFCAQSGCPDGRNPFEALIQGLDGSFYGTAPGGGANGSGTVFKITPSGTFTTLYSFCSQSSCADGGGPSALVQAHDGTLYGTTGYGGPGGTCASGCGTVFKITPSGTLTTLHSFNGTDGSAPGGALAQATDGSLYGTTNLGGANTCTFNGGLIGCGTIFKITPSGTLTTLYSFCSQSGCTDGEFPSAALVQATDGDLYGMTPFGGANSSCLSGMGCGTIFKITRSGTLTTLYSFCSQSNCTDGANSYAGLVQDTDGKFYGTAPGGVYAAGTVFSLDVGLGPFVKTQPGFGRVGKAVNILGTELTGTTSVNFNGTAATFTVVSSSLITTTVPAGATSGKVQVVTPGGTFSSNVAFRVLP